MNLKGKSFLTLLDFSPEEITGLLDLAADLKAKKKAGIPHADFVGKNIALIFEKTSTRTRCSFEVAAHDLGMGVTYLDPSGSQIGKKESIADTARVLGRMYDGIEYRGFGQEIVQTLAKYAGVPVWNGLTNEFHPTQILADFLTIREKFGRLAGVKLVYMGDARYNMGNSLMVGCAKMGMDFVACAPRKYFPKPELVDQCRAIAQWTGASLPEARAGGPVPRHRPVDRRVAELQRRPHGRRKGRAGDLYRRVGVHGRARRGMAGAHRRPHALSGERRADGRHRRGRRVHALPARLPRPEHRHRKADPRQVRPRRHGGHR